MVVSLSETEQVTTNGVGVAKGSPGSKRPKVRRRSPLERGPVALTRVAQRRNNPRRPHLEPDELTAFFRYLSNQTAENSAVWYAYFYIMFFYGCRLSEPALVLEDDLRIGSKVKNKTITIRRLKKSNEAEGYREYVCPISPSVLECITNVLQWKKEKGLGKNPFLFPSSRSTKKVGAERLSQLRSVAGFQAVSRFTAHRMFQRVAAHLKLPTHLRHNQVMRHTRAIFLLARGVKPEEVQKRMGHSSLKMTTRYEEASKEVRGKMTPSFCECDLGGT